MNINLSTVKPGLLLVLLVLTFGITMGIAFGINEDFFKDYVAQGIEKNPELHDANSQAKIWRYAQRAHFHATGIAAFSIGLLLLIAASTLKQKLMKVTSILIGLGGLYPFAWLSMYIFAPSLGRAAAHSHIVTELFTYLGVGSLVVGLSILISNLFFGCFNHEASDS